MIFQSECRTGLEIPTNVIWDVPMGGEVPLKTNIPPKHGASVKQVAEVVKTFVHPAYAAETLEQFRYPEA